MKVEIIDGYKVTTYPNGAVVREILQNEIVQTFDELKAEKLNNLKIKTDKLYQEYLLKYPDVEVASFQNKASESALVMSDNNIALSLTPYLSALTGNTTIENRNALAFAVNAKVIEMVLLESNAVTLRDAIKKATTMEELETIRVQI